MRAADLPPEDRQSYEALRRSVDRVEAIRASAGSWPSIRVLGERGVAPFARDDAGPYYDWSFLKAEDRVSYAGRPAVNRGSDLMLVVQEPKDPLAHPSGAPRDPSHRMLPDGSVIHVSIWMRPHRDDPITAGVLERPAELGWREVR